MVRFALFNVAFAALIAGTVVSVHGRALQDRAIDDIVFSSENLTTLAAAFSASQLVLLANVNYTVFGPINEAFAALDQEYLEKLLTPNWIAHLQNLLQFHATVAEDRILSSDLENGAVVKMNNGEDITVNVETQGAATAITLTSEFTEGSQVIKADILASNSNGVVHVVDSVLLPAFWNTSVFGLASTPAGDNFSILFELLASLKLGDLVNTLGDLTIFAPTNAAFEELGPALDALRNNTQALTTTLLNHVLMGITPSAFVTGGLTVTAFNGYNLIFSFSDDGNVTVGFADLPEMNGATIVAVDILANNGIMHAIDKVLILEGFQVPGGAPGIETAAPAVPAPRPTPLPTSAPAPTPTIFSPTISPVLAPLSTPLPNNSAIPSSATPSEVRPLTSTVKTEQNTSVTITTFAGETKVTVTAFPRNGNLQMNIDGTITYTPNPGYDGVDDFDIKRCSADEKCPTETIVVVVLAAPASNSTKSSSNVEKSPSKGIYALALLALVPIAVGVFLFRKRLGRGQTPCASGQNAAPTVDASLVQPNYLPAYKDQIRNVTPPCTSGPLNRTARHPQDPPAAAAGAGEPPPSHRSTKKDSLSRAVPIADAVVMADEDSDASPNH